MTQPEMSIDGGVSVGDVERRIEAQEKRISAFYLERDQSPQISAANSLIQALGELQHIRKLLEALNEGQGLFGGGDRAVSSVEVKFLAPTKDHPEGKPQPVIKVYAGSVPPVEEAIAAYGKTFLMAQQAAIEGWEQTLDVLQAERSAESVAALERDGTA